MKKFLVLLVAISFLFVPVAFAETQIPADGTSINNIAFKPSTSVLLFVNSTDSSYAAAAKHTQGTKYYLATDASPDISNGDCAKGTDITDSAAAGCVN